MRALRYDRVLAGTALALILAASAGTGHAAPDTPAAFEAAVPMPEAPLPPPTIADISPAPVTEAPATTKSCDAQTWPYIEQRCLAGKASEDKRPVRLVTAPVNEPSTNSATPSSAPPLSAAPSGSLVSRDTVLRAPNYYNSIPAVPDNLASDQRLTRKQMRREARKQRTERRWAAQSYQVPGEFDRRSARPIVVVRPLRLDAFR